MAFILLSAAQNYKKLLSKTYQFFLGKKGQQTILNLKFSEEYFVHLAGLHKLNGITFPTKSKGALFHLILDGTITDKLLQTSKGFSEITSRLRILECLRECFSSPNMIVKFSKISYIQGSQLRWDYLLEFRFDGKVGYLFMGKSKNFDLTNDGIPFSIFEKTVRDYTVNQEKYTLLKILEIDQETMQSTELYTR